MRYLKTFFNNDDLLENAYLRYILTKVCLKKHECMRGTVTANINDR